MGHTIIKDSLPHNYKEQYLTTPDLKMAESYTVPRWNWHPGKIIANLQLPGTTIHDGKINIRSRIAQAGLVVKDGDIVKQNLFKMLLLNYSSRDIILPQGFGFGPLYRPSKSLTGEALFETVRTGVTIDPEYLYFMSYSGEIISSLGAKPNDVPNFHAFGIKVNTEKMWEVDPKPPEPLVINDDLHTREAVNQYLVPVEEGVTTTPFVVTTTMPADIHGFDATVLTDFYQPLRHSDSVLHSPNEKYKWNGLSGEGVRLEIIATDKYWISKQDLETDFPVAWFTAH